MTIKLEVGKTYRTRSTNEERIVVAPNPFSGLYIVADPTSGHRSHRYENGYSDLGYKSSTDLVEEVKVKVVKWGIIYREEGDRYIDDVMYDTEDEAERCHKRSGFVTIAKVEWEE